MSVHTGTYQNEVSRTAMSPEAYVQGCTSTDCLVPPYTRCTGFRMYVLLCYSHGTSIIVLAGVIAIVRESVVIYF